MLSCFKKSIIILIFIFIPFQVLAEKEIKVGTILVNNLNMRIQPNKNKKPKYILKKGDKVNICKYEKEWLQVSFMGTTGYIKNRKKYIEIVTEKINIFNKDININKKKDKLNNICKNIAKKKKKLIKISKKENKIIDLLDKINSDINLSQNKLNKIKNELKIINKNIYIENIKYDQLIKEIDKNKKYISKRLISYYKINMVGKFNLLASANSLNEFIIRKKALKNILINDGKILKRLNSDKKEVFFLIDKQKKNKFKKDKKEIDLKKYIIAVNNKKKENKELIKNIRNKKTISLASINILNKQAHTLDQILLLLQIKKQKIIKKDIKIEFLSTKGMLAMPVNGRIIKKYGSNYSNNGFSNGIVIRADRGDPIRSVYNGNVLFSGWFKGYGNMVIIDHGSNYYTVYAYAEELFKKKGDYVEQNEVIATVGKKSIKKASLYFEVRHYGKSINPLEWLKKRS